MAGEIKAALAATIIAAGTLGCQPTSVTEAREQIGREASGYLELTLPVADTTYFVSEFLEEQDTATTSEGLLGVNVQSDSLTAVDYGQFLTTEEISTSLAFPAPPAAAPPGGTRDTLRFQTPQGSDIVGAVVTSGFVVHEVTNNTGCSGSVQITIYDDTGTAVLVLPTLIVGVGATETDSSSAAGVTVSGFLDIETNVNINSPCTPIPGATVASTVTIRPLQLTSVTLDNVNELIGVEEFREIKRSDVGFDDFEEAIRQATLHNASISLTVVNSADLPVVLDNFLLGAVQLDGSGAPIRDGMGNPQYEEDGNGNPIRVSVTDPGQTTFTIPRQSTKTVTVDAAQLVDRMVQLVLNDDRVAFAAAALATGGDSTLATVTDQDAVDVAYDVVVGLDISIPMTGVSFTRNQTVDGLDLSSGDAADIVERLEVAGLTAVAQNLTAFGATVEIALAPDSLGPDDDVFAHPQVVLIDPVSLDAPPVDTQGLPQQSTTSDVELSLTGTDVEVVLGPKFTAGIRIRLMPGAGGNGRGAIRPADGVAIDAAIDLQIRRGTQ